MGMFDYLRCEADTPDGWKPANGLFQTKDLDCTLEVHRITADGRLMRTEIVGYDDVPESEWEYRDAKPGTLEAIWHEGSKHRPRRREVEEPWHGYIEFYGNEVIGHEAAPRYPTGKRPVYRWHEYRAKFTDGRLVEITGGVKTLPQPSPQ